MAHMLSLYRRHQTKCPHKGKGDNKGRKYRRCSCPVWVAGLLSGVPIKKSLDTRNWDKAQRMVRDWEIEGRITAEEPSQVELTAACQRFKDDAKARGLSTSTLKKYSVLFSQLQEFCQFQGLRFVHQLDLEWLRKFRESWKDSSISALKKLERLRTACGFWKESGWLEDNPAKAIRPPKVTNPPTLPFTDEQLADLLGAVERLGGLAITRKRIYALQLVLRYSGLRIGDAVRLHESRVLGNRIRLYTQKTGTHVDVPVPQFVVNRLAELPTHRGFYFVTGEGSPATDAGNYRRTFRRLAKLAGVTGAHPHQFRDTFAVSLLQSGVPIEDVSVLLGHRDIKVTQRHYSPWVKSRQDALERNVEKALAGEMEPKVVAIRKAAG